MNEEIDDGLEYVVIDLETTIRNKRGDFKASPHCQDNEIVLAGVLQNHNGGTQYEVQVGPYAARLMPPASDKGLLLVGHNIGFDLLYLYYENYTYWRDFFARGGRIWDTMIVEYLLSGQSVPMPSLNKCSEKRGGTQKADIIKDYWDAGVDTDMIPHWQLEEYLISDVLNTNIVFKSQLVEAAQKDMLPLINSMMDARLATIEMEFNGMRFDINHANGINSILLARISKIENQLAAMMSIRFGPDVTINVNSSKQRVVFFFGGELTYEYDSHVIVDGLPYQYKSGKKKGLYKTKKTKGKIKISENASLKGYKTVSDKGNIILDETTLKRIEHDLLVPSNVRKYAHLLLELRELQKESRTYMEGYCNLAWDRGGAHYINPQFNHAIAATGRLTCSGPNLQQVTNAEDD